MGHWVCTDSSLTHCTGTALPLLMTSRTQQERERPMQGETDVESHRAERDMMRLTFSKAHAGCRVEDGLEGSQDDSGRPFRGDFNSL